MPRPCESDCIRKASDTGANDQYIQLYPRFDQVAIVLLVGAFLFVFMTASPSDKGSGSKTNSGSPRRRRMKLDEIAGYEGICVRCYVLGHVRLKASYPDLL